MEDRKKRTMIIGILCCLLVFMGVGFAVMNATLNINGTATAINTWDVRMTNIVVVEKSDGATNNEELTKINDDGITAIFRSNFTKPGDYITYEVTVENNGSIDAILKDISITLNVAEIDKDLFNIADTRPNNELLSARTSTTFKIKVEFKSTAHRMPSSDIEYTVKVDYSQPTGEIIDGEEEYEDWLYQVDDSGTITAYNYYSKLVEDTSVAVVPSEVNGVQVKKVNQNSFTKTNASVFQNADGTASTIIYDEENFDLVGTKLEEMFTAMGAEMGDVKKYHYGDSDIPTNVTLQNFYIDITKNGTDIYGANETDLKSIDFKGAIYLEEIGNNTFEKESDSKNKLESVEFPTSGNLHIIGEYAFTNNNLDSLTIPNGVKTIGNNAFRFNKIDNLEIPDSVTYIGDYAFQYNNITSLTLSPNLSYIGLYSFGVNSISGEVVIPSSLTTLKGYAFLGNQITKVVIPSSITNIEQYVFQDQFDSEGNHTLTSIVVKRTEEDFLTNVTVSEPWYDNSLRPTITYELS